MQEAVEKLFPKIFQAEKFSLVLWAIFAGILVGVLFGERTHIFVPLANIYIMLLQAAIFPFLICTLLASLGKLEKKTSLQLFLKGLPIYILLISITYLVLLILAHVLPPATTPLRPESTTPQIINNNLLVYLIPDNIFSALVNSYIPAIIIFCILFGIMLQRLKKKEMFLFTIFDTISRACLIYWNMLLKVAPIGVFFIFSDIAGTMRFDNIEALSPFLFLFIFGGTLLAFWLIPAIVSSFTDLTYREIMKSMFSTLVICAATTLSILSLPYIKKITQQHYQNKKNFQSTRQAEDIIDTILIVGYPIAHLGGNFLYLFMIFAAMYFNQPLTWTQHLSLPFVTYFSAIGSPNVDIGNLEFLAKFLNLPVGQVTNLYDQIAPIIKLWRVVISVMGFFFLAILITAAYCGRLHFQMKKFFTHIVLVTIILLTIAYFGRHFIPDPGIRIYQRLTNYRLSPQLTKGVQVTFLPSSDNLPPVIQPEDSLYRIQRTGVLRVGFSPDVMPFSFFNAQHQLVGFDVAYMYELAKEMNVRIEFIPFAWKNLVADLQNNKFDIAIGAIVVTPYRLEKIDYTQPYLKSLAAFIVPRDRVHDFTNIQKLQSEKLQLGVPNDRVFITFAEQNFPNASLVPLPDYYTQRYIPKYLTNNLAQAILWVDSISHIWALGHPDFVPVTPTGFLSPFLQAFMVQSDSPQFLRYVNYWLKLKENDGFRERTYRHWVLVQPTPSTEPRWNIVNNVLHW